MITSENGKRVLPGQVYTRLGPYINKRGKRYQVRWSEHDMRHMRTFSTFQAANAFVRDYVVPYKLRECPLPPSAIAPQKGSGWLYIFKSTGPGEPVKVGWSTDPAKRLKYLATGHPYKLELVLLLPGPKGLERTAHNLLAEFRLEGEWFSREAQGELVRRLVGALS